MLQLEPRRVGVTKCNPDPLSLASVASAAYVVDVVRPLPLRQCCHSKSTTTYLCDLCTISKAMDNVGTNS